MKIGNGNFATKIQLKLTRLCYTSQCNSGGTNKKFWQRSNSRSRLDPLASITILTRLINSPDKLVLIGLIYQWILWVQFLNVQEDIGIIDNPKEYFEKLIDGVE